MSLLRSIIALSAIPLRQSQIAYQSKFKFRKMLVTLDFPQCDQLFR